MGRLHRQEHAAFREEKNSNELQPDAISSEAISRTRDHKLIPYEESYKKFGYIAIRGSQKRGPGVGRQQI